VVPHITNAMAKIVAIKVPVGKNLLSDSPRTKMLITILSANKITVTIIYSVTDSDTYFTFLL
jgi:hypothetical protein